MKFIAFLACAVMTAWCVSGFLFESGVPGLTAALLGALAGWMVIGVAA